MSSGCINNIVVMGDSLSRGVVYDEEKKKYSIIPDNFFNQIQAKLNASLYNVSRFGITLTRSAAKIGSVLTKKPSAVLIEFGGNDCNFNWKEISDAPTLKHLPQTPVKQFEAELSALIADFKQRGIKPICMTLPPLDAARFFHWVTTPEDINPAHVLQWLGCVEKIYWWHEQYNAIILDVADEAQVDVIHVRSDFLKQEDFRDFLCIDGMHPNEKGHALIAQRIERFIAGRYGDLLE